MTKNFSQTAREIFEHFKFEEFVGQLADASLLYIDARGWVAPK